jgi:hypothetical protein
MWALLYRFVNVAGWFADGDRRDTIGFIGIVARPASLAPFQ